MGYKNVETRRAAVRAYKKSHPAETLAHKAKYRAKHAEQIAAYKRAYRAAHAEEALAYNRAYAAAHPEGYRLWARRRYARKRGAAGSHTVADVREQYERQRGRCYWCRARVRDSYHVDHVIPLALGGSDGPENIVIACPHCNLSKQDKLPQEFADRLC